MGEIVPAMLRPPGRRVLLVGQAPGADGDLRPLTGTMGLKLAKLAGVDGVPPRGFESVHPEERIGLWFDRANVLDFYPGRPEVGKGHSFPLGHAAAAASLMWPHVREYDRVLFCGKAVKESFKRSACSGSPQQLRMWREMPMLSWCVFPHLETRFAWMPHTSMIVPWWNDPKNQLAAAEFLHALAAWTRRRPRLVDDYEEAATFNFGPA